MFCLEMIESDKIILEIQTPFKMIENSKISHHDNLFEKK